MRRPPRAPDEPLFSGPLIGWSLLQGAFAFVLVAAIFIVAFRRGMPEAEVRALTFFSLVLTIVGLIFVNRSFSASLVTALRRPNPALAWVLLAVTTMLGLTLLWPFASGSLPLRTSARGRSRVDAWRRRSCACRPRAPEAPMARTTGDGAIEDYDRDGAPMSTEPRMPASQVLALQSLITPTEQGIASRILAKTAGGNVTLFAFDAGQGLTEHTSPFDALVLVLDGALTLTVGGAVLHATPGTIVRLPAAIPHAVDAPEPARMLLVMLKDA